MDSGEARYSYFIATSSFLYYPRRQVEGISFLVLSSERCTGHGSHQRMFSESYDAASIGGLLL